MKQIDLGQTLGVLANLAVVAGIVFLAIQIREERDYAIVENTTIVGHGMADWMSSVAHDRDRADIIFRGSQDFKNLAPLEQFEFDLLMRSWIMRIEMGRLAQGRKVSPQGSGPGGESTVLTGNLIRFFDSPGTRQWWGSADKRGIPKGAVAYIDKYLSQLVGEDSGRQ
ncbi:MAG: hypothetical protein PVJ78_07650 [Gammaproteobacteria bacterium]|jgi:hypothetical protein